MLDERLAHSTGSEVRRLSPGNTLTVTQNPAPTVTTPTVVMSPDRAMSASTLARLERSVPTETRRAYSGDWARFSTWCAEHGRTPLPATAETLAGYCNHLADAGRAPSTMHEPSPLSATPTPSRKPTRHRLNWPERSSAQPPPTAPTQVNEPAKPKRSPLPTFEPCFDTAPAPPPPATGH